MLQIRIWDVQHGSAAHIQTPNNRHIVVDLGDDGDEFSPLLRLRSEGVLKLDHVVITHPHRDHMDDIAHFGSLSPSVLSTPRHLSEADIRKGNRLIDSGIVNQYLAIRQGYTSPIPAIHDIGAANNFGGAQFHVFMPSGCEPSNLNNHSLVVVAAYAGLKVVIPGDNEAPSWRELLQNSAFVSAICGADVLVAAHHGRDAGYCADLFDAMGNPRLVVISDGRFGDTSATGRYGRQVTGWNVYNAYGVAEQRRCVTTRCDGDITIKIGWNNPADASQGNYLNVSTRKRDVWAALAKALSGSI